MKILIACEESQTVTIAFRNKGHEAYSCDIKPCTGGHPEWHIQDDLFKIIYRGGYDLMIGHPPCTYLTVTANKWLKNQPERSSGVLVGEARREAQREAIAFFAKMYHAPINKICLENPIGCMNSILPPTQIIQPYYFGDEAQKTTCLWLKGLPPLFHAKEADLFNSDITHVGKGAIHEWVNDKGEKKSMPHWYAYAKKEDRSTTRSKTFPGIAKAMADQWG